MQKLDHPPAGLAFPVAVSNKASAQPAFGHGSDRRLLVVVSDSEMDSPAAARKIIEVASAFRSGILFLGLCADEMQEPSLRRQLITLSAMIRDANVPFESKVESGKDWLQLIRSNWREGDVLVCFNGQGAGARRGSLAALLESNFPATVYVLNSVSQPQRNPSNRLRTFIAWAGSIGIILGFFWLQTQLASLPRDWAHSALMYLSLFIEVGFILLWNSLF